MSTLHARAIDANTKTDHDTVTDHRQSRQLIVSGPGFPSTVPFTTCSGMADAAPKQATAA
jgi:hypothetical protein